MQWVKCLQGQHHSPAKGGLSSVLLRQWHRNCLAADSTTPSGGECSEGRDGPAERQPEAIRNPLLSRGN